jgi:hypothetical protein
MSTAPIAMIGPARDGREHRARDHGDHGQPTRDLTNQALDSVDHLQGEPGMEENLAHQDEERNWRQREIDHRRGAVPEHLA